MPFKSKNTDEIWASMKNAEDGLGAQNIFDVVLKEIHLIGEKFQREKI